MSARDLLGFPKSNIGNVLPTITPWKIEQGVTFSSDFAPYTAAFWSRRVGNDLQLRGRFQSGATGSNVGYVFLPKGYVIDYTLFAAPGQSQAFDGAFRLGQAVVLTSSTAGGTTVLSLVYDGYTNVNPGNGGTNNGLYFAYRTGADIYLADPNSTFMAAGDCYDITISVPVINFRMD